jgi:hypothetical protein
MDEMSDDRTPEQKAHDEKRWQWILTGAQAQVVYDALGFWSSDYNDAPHGEIHELRERLRRMEAIRP